MSDIRLIQQNGIDRSKWDAGISNAPNSLIYAHSVYLDAMCHWDALVLDDYAAVMPLPNRKKFGISYLHQPAFIQQLGIFSSNAVAPELVNEFIQVARKHFRFAEITLNHQNDHTALQMLTVSGRCNYILKLNSSYERIYENYSSSLKRKLVWIKKFDSHYSVVTDPAPAIALYRKLYAGRMKSVDKKDFDSFSKLCAVFNNQGNLICREARNRSNDLLASLVLLNDGNRIYNIISCITESGKKVHANDFIYDELIQEFAGTKLTLDFEGSDIPGIAEFYQKFSPEKEMYPFVKWNDLRPLLKLFKK